MHIVKKEDGIRSIFYRYWKADQPKAVLLLVHGLGAHSARWGFLSEFFLKHNLSSYAIELRGYGEAVASKERPATLKTYFKDISHLYDVIRKENGLKKIFLVGESAGAIISLLMTMTRPEPFEGLICISPALKNAFKFTFFDYFKTFSPLLYNPEKLITLPFDYTACTRDTDYLKVIEKEHCEVPRATSKLSFDMTIGQLRCRALKNKLKIPLLFLIPGRDTIMVPEASRVFFNGLRLEDKTLMEYPDMYHAISIDTDREEAFGDILKWLKNRI